MELTLLGGAPEVHLNALVLVAGIAGGVWTTRFAEREGLGKLGLLLAVGLGALSGFLLALDDPGRGQNFYYQSNVFRIDVEFALFRTAIGAVAAALGGIWARSRFASRRLAAANAESDQAEERETSVENATK
ncbi:MAG: hypothetical protein J6K25_07665 [Thermoguttaceae bacterium]|nr:hypothetical protein [Thermoguttaceae bacterium]